MKHLFSPSPDLLSINRSAGAPARELAWPSRARASEPWFLSRGRSSSRCKTALPWALSLLWLVALSSSLGATLSDPEVDRYNVRIGTETFAGLYQFSTNSLLVETAEAIRDLGSDTIKMYLGSAFPRQYHLNLPGNVTSLLTLARDEPSCRRALDMPFRHIIAWAYPFSTSDAAWRDGYSVTERANDYRELYDLTRYLLTNYNNSGKTFYLGHWEGDGYLAPWTTNAGPTAIQGMIDWLNNRQKAIDDAKAATVYTNVQVYGYAEANRVRDAMLNGPENNQRVINSVIPYVTNLDYLSYSSYDAMNLSQADLYATLDYMESKLPSNKASSLPGERIWIGEYGWGGDSTSAQEPLTRAYIQRLLNYGRKAFPFILFWEIYNNETNRNFCLIDPNNVKVPCYYLHQRFINNARMLVAQFKETNSRLPSDAEFVSMVSPMLDSPLPAPFNLSITNLGATVSSTGAVTSVSGIVAQGVYGSDAADVWVYWGRQDGGAARSGWEQSRHLGLHANFNPGVFTTVLTNLIPQTNYFFRFYATNADGDAWAPSSGQFTTTTLSPSDYGSRMKIGFAGYNRSEALQSFPALVKLGPALSGLSYGQFASPTGGDLRFTAADGVSLLPHEIDRWDTGGDSFVWVRLPRLESTNDFIWAYWGNPDDTNAPSWTTNGAVWSPEHLLVWHLGEPGFPYADGALAHPATTGVAPTPLGGLIGGAELFNGSSQFLSGGAVDAGDAFTLSAWVKLDPGASDIQTVWANKPGGWNTPGVALYVNSYQTSDQKLILESGNGTTGVTASTSPGAVTVGQWHRVTAVVNKPAGTSSLYVDGVNLTQSAGVQPDFSSQGDLDLAEFTDGAFHLKGSLDEVRIEAGTRSANWVWASWMTVASNATFSGYSSIIRQTPALLLSAGPGGPLMTWPSAGVGFALYTATNLAPPVFWALVTNVPTLTSTGWQVHLPTAATGPRFYRLQGN